jgi:hypothetical protein
MTDNDKRIVLSTDVVPPAPRPKGPVDNDVTDDDIVTDTPTIPANDLVLAKSMADTLHSHYPGHLWAVTVNGAQGVADIRNLALSGNWGFRLILVGNYSISEFLDRVKRAGGEILERYNLARGRLNLDALANLKTDRLGRTVGDLS